MGSYWFHDYIPSWVNRWRPAPRPAFIQRWPTPNYTPGEDVLGVLNVDMCFDENSNDHHTNRFVTSHEYLIVRRGEPFRLRISFNRPYDANKDAISFMFTIADDKKPSPGHGTLVGITPFKDDKNLGDIFEWGVIIDYVQGNSMSVLIKPAVTCPVTQWKLDIDTKLLGRSSRSHSIQTPIYILFNPWCRDDQVFLDNREERKEYLLNDTTLIWRGSYNRMRPSVWKIGQFERYILECSIKLIATVGKVPAAHRGDPVRVARALSAAVNSVDDDGVMLGNWTEDFSGGIPPTKWIGSVEILQEFYRTQKPVKFAQCWNFSGVLTTVARALGMPSRIVTNYSSAHDTQGSLTVDIFIDQNNRKMEEETSDSIWNYHVWNEIWMDRPDLGVGPNGSYGGWQAVDATPQESSDEMYRCGPASVAAVKQGEILRPYDCGFLYSEVNADKVYWRYNGPFQPIKLIRKDALAIGHLISTKAVGKWTREDITNTYKFEEKTEEERNTMVKALKQSRHAFSRYYLNDNFNEVEFDMQLKDDIKIGENFTVVVKITNKSKEKEHIAAGYLNADTVLYTGLNNAEVKSIGFEVELKPDTSEYVRMEVNFDDYYAKLLPEAAFNISCSGKVKGTDWEYFAQDDFRVRKPDIKFSFQGKVIAKESVDVIVRLTNPLPIPLKKGLFYIEGPGIEKSLRFKIAEIPVGGTAASTFKFIPPYSGRGTLIGKFNSKELDDVDGYLHFEIEPRPEDIIMNESNVTRTEAIVRRTDVIP
ncbi:annulin isoform X2 [Eupeodes corollae]|uniref:annulin isoform X2 n=1 Tax=Eupeodes corollae TaxID=290404 RepID=UPI002490EE48|nr:annulin isoform X2 [Eupeodes corollae]